MNSYSVKTFKKDSLSSLELEIDNWLYNHNFIKITNISHSTNTVEYSACYTAVILYKKD